MARLLAILSTILLIKLIRTDVFDLPNDSIFNNTAYSRDVEEINNMNEKEVVKSLKNVIDVDANSIAQRKVIEQMSQSERQQVWLGKALTSYYENLFYNETSGDTISYLHFVDKIQNGALVTDSKFDAVAMNYNKAGAILRMISHVITKSQFSEKMRLVLIKRVNESITSADLFGKISGAYKMTGLSLQDFRKALLRWITTPGYPIINVRRQLDKNVTKITQERFFTGNSDSDSTQNGEKKYWIPLNYAQKKSDFNDTRVIQWLSPSNTGINIPDLDSNKWVIFNKQQFGFYRVNYDEKNWEMIIETLKSENYMDIHVLNRAQLIDDAFELAAQSRLNYTIAFKLITYLKNETDLIPWIAGIHAMTNLHDRVSRTEVNMFCMAHFVDLIRKLEERIKYYSSLDDDEITIYTRNILQKLACRTGSDICAKTGSDILHKWLEDSTNNFLPKYPQLLCAGVAYNNKNHEGIRQFVKKLTETRNKHLYEPLVACTYDNNIFRKPQWNVLSDPSVDLVDGLRIMVNLYSLKSFVNVQDILDFLVKEQNKFIDISQKTKATLYESFEKFGSMVTTQNDVNLMKDFSEKNQQFLLDTMKGGIAKAQWNVDWFNEHQNSLYGNNYMDKNIPQKVNVYFKNLHVSKY